MVDTPLKQKSKLKVGKHEKIKINRKAMSDKRKIFVGQQILKNCLHLKFVTSDQILYYIIELNNYSLTSINLYIIYILHYFVALKQIYMIYYIIFSLFTRYAFGIK